MLYVEFVLVLDCLVIDLVFFILLVYRYMKTQKMKLSFLQLKDFDVVYQVAKIELIVKLKYRF